MTTFHVFSRGSSPYWWCWYYDPDTGKRRQKSTKRLKSQFTQRQVQHELDVVTHDKLPRIAPRPMMLVEMTDSMLERLECEGKRPATVKEYRIALNHLINYCACAVVPDGVLDFHPSIIWPLQKYLLSIGQRHTTANKTFRHLQGTFKRLAKERLLRKILSVNLIACRKPRRLNHCRTKSYRVSLL